MIPGATSVSDSLDLISGFRRILWQAFNSLSAKELKDLCFTRDKNIAQSIQQTASIDIL